MALPIPPLMHQQEFFRRKTRAIAPPHPETSQSPHFLRYCDQNHSPPEEVSQSQGKRFVILKAAQNSQFPHDHASLPNSPTERFPHGRTQSFRCIGTFGMATIGLFPSGFADDALEIRLGDPRRNGSRFDLFRDPCLGGDLASWETAILVGCSSGWGCSWFICFGRLGRKWVRGDDPSSMGFPYSKGSRRPWRLKRKITKLT